MLKSKTNLKKKAKLVVAEVSLKNDEFKTNCGVCWENLELLRNKYVELNVFLKNSSFSSKLDEIKQNPAPQIVNKVVELIKVVYQHVGLLEDEFWYFMFLDDGGNEKKAYQFKKYHTEESINFNFENLQDLANEYENEGILSEESLNEESKCENTSKELETERDNIFNPLKPNEESFLLVRFIKNICKEFTLKFEITKHDSNPASSLNILDPKSNKRYNISFKNNKQFKNFTLEANVFEKYFSPEDKNIIRKKKKN